MKTCTKCNKTKLESEFRKSLKRGKPGLRAECKECSRAYTKAWYKENKNGYTGKAKLAMRKYNYKTRYDLPEELINHLVEDNTGNCTICGNKTVLHIDHCHATGNYRGLLCRNCNLMLGYSKDNMNTLKNAIEYLNKFTSDKA